MIITEDRIILETGILNKSYKEIFIRDIRVVEIDQSLIQRIFKIGDIRIATSATESYEDIAKGIKYPQKVREIINNLKTN